MAQDSVRVVRVIDNTPQTAIDSFLSDVYNNIFISLDEGFKDSINVTVNGVPYLNKYLETNESIGYAGGFGISFKDSTQLLVMKIKFVNANFYIQETVNVF